MGRLAEGQWGVVGRAQLERLGLRRGGVTDWVARGRLVRVFHGVYAVGYEPLTREGRWLAAVLACGDGSVLSHRSAAAHLGIIAADGASVDVTVPRSRRGIGGISTHRARSAPPRFDHRGIPTTTGVRTLLDIAPTFAIPHLERAFGEAELLRLVGDRELEEALASGRPGARRLRSVANRDFGPGVPRNVMERRFRRIIRDAGLPAPISNESLLGYEIDFLWPERRLAVETDGRGVHTRRAAFARDRAKDRKLQLSGFVVLRFTHAEIMRQPELVAAACRRALAG